MKTYFAKQLFDGKQFWQNVTMSVENGVIVRFDNNSVPQDPSACDYLQGTVASGFIDIQVNGGGGVLFNDQVDLPSIKKIVSAHCRYGTTSIMPTLITDSNEKMKMASDAVAAAIEQNLPGVIGIHFEGPHLSQLKRGIHSSAHVRAINDKDLSMLTRVDIGKVMVTVAPENMPPDVIKELVAQGVTVSLGHSGASSEQTIRAIEAGASGFTHLFNAMSGLTAREPGMIAAALMQANVYAGLIVDLHHVHPHNCALAFKLLGHQQLMLVTDAMAHVGCDLQSIPWFDSTINKVGSKLVLEDGSLAGSCLNMADAVRNMYHVIMNNNLAQTDASTKKTEASSAALKSVLAMASSTPANFIGLPALGKLQIGTRADFIQLDENLRVTGTWIAGKKVFGH